jgi:DNA-binding MarR family transcriptional regulator
MSAATDPARQRLLGEVLQGMRSMRAGLLSVDVGVRAAAGLRAVELDVLDALDRGGAQSPGSLSAATGLAPGTMTGVLDRLEETGWVRRERSPEDRRAVRVVPVPDRARELAGRYAPMNDALVGLLTGYSDAELATILDFLRGVGRAADDAAGGRGGGRDR